MITRKMLERLAIGETYTATVAEWIQFTDDVGSAEGEGFGWVNPRSFFRVVEVNEAAGTATVRRER